ncbi:DUF4214 domain-containing protein, partial [Myxococcota bacterium]|nr:DUF4214 domain-containing protein [Myxococcota bacterium]
ANNDNDCSPICGNSIIENGESCDNNCPSSCYDGVVCTTDTLVGGDCNKTCSYTSISDCTAGDGCCPGACNENTDADCAATCGNNSVESGELCDGNCPETCSDGQACTSDNLVGSACTRECVFTDITNCINSDGCCPDNCNANNDNDCSPVCGNTIIESGETCDSNCPTFCDDSNSCTSDVLSGGTCTKVCSNTTITSCVSGDGCCPSACDQRTDSDCCPTDCVLYSDGFSCENDECLQPATTVCGPCGGYTLNASDTSDEGFLKYAYAYIFNRRPDTGGYAYWLGELNKTVPVERWVVIKAFIYTDTFSIHHELSPTIGEMTNEEFVAWFFDFFFRRPAEPGGITYWAAQGDKTDIVRFLSSGESGVEMQTANPPLWAPAP